ncbi:MAG: aldo/keto reductase, partial [Planctomycetaceae bacterium]
MTENALGRRDFLKAGVAAGAAAAAFDGGLFHPAAWAAEKPESAAAELGKIPTRPFGKTSWKLPILGMGGSAMIQQWKKEYGVALLPLEERIAMVRHAYDRGVRYFDTARVYGESESI